MYNSDQLEGESPDSEAFNKRKETLRFELPQLPVPVRLNKPSMSTLTNVKYISADVVDENNGRAIRSQSGYNSDIACSYGTTCVTPSTIMEPHCAWSGQPFHRNMSIQKEENAESENLQSVSGAIQNSLQLPIRPERKHSLQDVRFSDITGHASVKLRIDELILPLGLPSAVAESVLKGIRSIPASILLYGPPGCGKTKLARAIAGEARSAFISVAPSDILSKFVGESEASIREIFRKAVGEGLMCNSKSVVVFFDEIDALGQSRESSNSGEGGGCSRRVLSELLLLLNIVSENRKCGVEHFSSCSEASQFAQDQHNDSVSQSAASEDTGNLVNIIVVAATNRIEDCDSALLRRFGIQLEVGLPALRDRKKMLHHHLKDIEHTLEEKELQILAAMTDQWSGSSLERLAREACMRPIRECLHKAAVIRRRSETREQRSGDVSGQFEDPDSPDVAAHTCLLESFLRLRPVTADDFRHALGTLTGQKVALPDYGIAKRAKRSAEHYDSSSSSSDDEY